jgi:manganese transport protein
LEDNANYTLIHVVETVGAIMYGENIEDHETTIDKKLLKNSNVDRKDLKSDSKLGFGKPMQQLPKL